MVMVSYELSITKYNKALSTQAQAWRTLRCWVRMAWLGLISPNVSGFGLDPGELEPLITVISRVLSTN